jgi:hypothetical protein
LRKDDVGPMFKSLQGSGGANLVEPGGLVAPRQCPVHRPHCFITQVAIEDSIGSTRLETIQFMLLPLAAINFVRSSNYDGIYKRGV